MAPVQQIKNLPPHRQMRGWQSVRVGEPGTGSGAPLKGVPRTDAKLSEPRAPSARKSVLPLAAVDIEKAADAVRRRAACCACTKWVAKPVCRSTGGFYQGNVAGDPDLRKTAWLMQGSCIFSLFLSEFWIKLTNSYKKAECHVA